MRGMKKTLAAIFAAVFACSIMVPATDVHATQTGTAGMVRSIYTNELIPAAQAQNRPIAIMMPTDAAAQPSYGISHAKVLYEIMEEGEISRQMAIIDDWQSLSKIGNIRSCRAYYIPIATEWDPILIHFGGVWYMKDRISMPDINNLSGTYEYGTGGNTPGSANFFRTTDRPSPHNAYISAAGINKACKDLGYSTTIRSQYYAPHHFAFASGINTLEQYGPKAMAATNIDLSEIFPSTKSSLAYNATDGLYYKSIHGKKQTDGQNGKQLAFANVIIQNAKWMKLDSKGYLAFYNYDTTQDGYYFTKGKAIHITWQKTSDYVPTKYLDDNGNEIQLNEGKTYIAVAQAGRNAMFN